jgi:hypothetical protein
MYFLEDLLPRGFRLVRGYSECFAVSGALISTSRASKSITCKIFIKVDTVSGPKRNESIFGSDNKCRAFFIHEW